MISNNFPDIDLTQVYLAPAADSDWGENDLGEVIQPGQSEFWTLAPGEWDIKIIRDDGDPIQFENENIIIDATLSLPIGG